MSFEEDIERVLNAPESDLEELACQFISHEDAENGVRFVVDKVKANFTENDTDRIELLKCLDLFAYLLLYNVIDPLQLLQACIYTDEFNSLKICGTSRFDEGVNNHLKLDACKSLQAKHPSLVNETRSLILVDFLEQNDSKQHNDIVSQNMVIALNSKPSKVEIDTRALLHSSMIADEASMKIEKTFKKDTQVAVIQGILSACYDLKMYNRLFGKVMANLIKKNHQLWYSALLKVVTKTFGGEYSEIDQVYKLKAVGTWIGHLLGCDVLKWSDFFSLMSLDSDKSTSSSRIMFLAVLEELKQDLGKNDLEDRILNEEMESSVRDVLDHELAAGFWKLAGLSKVAAKSAYVYRSHEYAEE